MLKMREISAKFLDYKILYYLIFLAVILRFVFVFISPIDAWETDSSNHALFSREIAETNSIPTYSLHQPSFFISFPPLYHLIGAVFLKLFTSLRFLQLVSAIFGIMSIILCYISFKKISKEFAVLAAFFVAIYPLVFRLNTTIMVDSLTIFFSFLTLYAFNLLNTTKEKKHAILLISSLVLLLFSKATGIVVLGILVIWKLIERTNFKIFFSVFAISLILASGWYVRNYINFGNPFTWNAVSTQTRSPIDSIVFQLTTNYKLFFIRFWDSIESVQFASSQGIALPIYVNLLLNVYLALSSIYFLFFVLGLLHTKGNNRIMIVWLVVYVLFSLYFLTSGWDIGQVPRVTAFSVPMFSFLFAGGVTSLNRYKKFVVPFLFITGLIFLGFSGVKLFIKYRTEAGLAPGYAWIGNNVNGSSVVVSIRSAEVSLFSNKITTDHFSSDLFQKYSGVYIYNWKNDVYSILDCPNGYVCNTVYQDAVSQIYKVEIQSS